MKAIAHILNTEAIRDGIDAHIMSWYPKEACGLLVGDTESPRAVLAPNLADRYHELDPETYPRTAERAFVLDPMLIAKSERNGEKVLAIFHSHVRVGAYFSDEDVAQALSPFGDGPLYPGVQHVVFDAQDDGVKGYKVFGWSEEQGAFVEQ